MFFKIAERFFEGHREIKKIVPPPSYFLLTEFAWSEVENFLK
jgi:hypothetical protein